MAAAQQPPPGHGVVLIDSPWWAAGVSRTVGLAKTTQLVGSISPAQ